MRRFDWGRAAFLAVICGVGMFSQSVYATAAMIGAGVPQAAGSVQSGGWTVSGDFERLLAQPRTWAAGADGGIVGTESVALEGGAGELALTATEAVGADAAVGAIAACVASVVCGVGVAAVAAIAVGYRIHANGDGTVDIDKGSPPGQQMQTVYLVSWAPSNLFPSAAAAGNFIAQQFNLGEGSSPSNTYFNGGILDDDGVSSAHMNLCSTPVGGTPPGWTQAGACGAYPIEITQKLQNNCAIQGDVPGADGQCPSHGANEATGLLPFATAKQLAEMGFNMNNPNNQAAAEGSIDADTPTQADIQVTGPASQQGPSTETTTTTTGTDGSTKTTTTTVTPTYNYDYDGNHVTVKETDTTKTDNGDGTSTTTTTTTSAPAGSASGASSGTANTPDLCALHPDALACDTLGTPPTDAPTWGTTNVTFTPEDIGMPSGCPAPRTFTVRGIVFALNYQPACDVAPMVSPALIAFTALGCALWIIAQVRAG